MSQRLYHSVLFIDARVADAGVLLASAAEGVLVVELTADGDGVEQIATALEGLEGLDSIQIVSHGASGQLQLGDTVLDAAGLADHAAALARWGGALRAGGDLLLYGCDVGQGDAGLAFIDALAGLTGADVAASTDTTGSDLLGANWVLEAATGSIEAASALSAQAQHDYAHTLALVNNGAAGTFTFGTNSNVTLLNASGLAAGAVVNITNILNTGLDLYTRSSNGGSIAVVNANGTNVIGLPVTDDRLTVNGSTLSPVSYVDLRANSGVFDLLSIKIGTGNAVGNLLGNTVFTVYALDANYQPTGGGQSVTGLLLNEDGVLNLASSANFKGIFGIRIVNALGFEVGIDDVQVANGRIAPSITAGAYNAATGVLTVTAAGINAGDSIDTSKLTVTGQGGSYTLTSSLVSATSGTAFAVVLNAADKLALAGVLNNNGGTAVDGTGFNLSAAMNWNASRPSGQDLTGNPITVASVQLPTITGATYDATSHVLTVTGANLVGTLGAANDIAVGKLSLRGEGGVAYTLNTTGNVEVTSATSFSVTLTGADVTAIAALFNKNGATSSGGASYQLVAADDWNSAIGNANTSVAGASLVVTNVVNSPPTITGVSAGTVNDNASINPFANVSVADVNGDNVSLTINYTGANGVLTGAGLSGSAGSYTLSATTPAALTALLKALTFTPTDNQVAVGSSVNTTFSLTATDANGLASAVNTGTVVSALSVNDAPVVSGTTAGQAVAAGGTVRPFSNVVISDPDVGSAVIVTITVSSTNAGLGTFTAASASAAGFVTSDGGLTYTHTSTAPGAAQAALQSLVFQAAPGQAGSTTLAIAVNDGHVIVSNTATTVQSTVPSSTTALSVTFSADSGSSSTDLITNVAAQTISGTLSAGLQSGEQVQVSLDNGVTWTNAVASVGGTAFTLAGQTLPAGAGVLQVRVLNGGGSNTPLSVSYALDTTAPTTSGAAVVFSSDSGASSTDLITRTAQQTVTGTLTAALAADEHVEVSLNNGATWTTASASTGSSAWSLAGVTLTGSDTLQVRVVDAAGNTGAAHGTAYVLDVAAPTATLSTGVSVIGGGQTSTVTVSFSEVPVGLSLASFSGVNGTVSNLQATADPRVYTIDYAANGGVGGVTGGVQLVAGSYTDVAGNAGAAAAATSMSITLGPTVVISSDKASLNASQVANLTFTFSSTPFGFTASDIVASGGTVSNLVNQGNGVYTALFTPGANVNGPASVTVTGGSYTDFLGLAGGSGATPAIAVDTVAPTLAIATQATALHLGASTTVVFTFSEPPLGFDASDVQVTNAVLSNFAPTANPLIYTALLTPNSGIASGVATVSVNAGAYTDAVGNAGVAAVSAPLAIDTVAPLITGNGVTFSADNGASSTDLVTNVAAQTLGGTLTAALASGDTVQVSLDNGATWVNAAGAAGSSSWSLANVTLPGSGTVQVRVADAAGNHGLVFGAAYVLDSTAPTVAVTSSAAALGLGQSAQLTFAFIEAPFNFTPASLAVTGGAISGFTATANPLVYTAVFTPTPGQSGATASVAVIGGSYSDLAGNGGQAGAPAAIAVNTVVPTLTITSNDSTLALGETAQITFTFSSAPTGFSAASISAGNGTLSGFTATANPLVYTAQFTPTAGLAAASTSVGVAGGAWSDAFGNSGSGAVSLPIAIDTLAPSLVVTSSSAQLAAGQTAQITFTFSEAPVGFDAAAITASGGVLSGLSATANPLVYTALLTPTAGVQGVTASFALTPGAVTDAAGNALGTITQPGLTIDTQAPVAVTGNVLFSADSGASATDLVTNVAAQTISGTLGQPLGAGEFVEVSLDNGNAWTTATSAGAAWSLAGQTLAGSNVVQVRVSDAAGNHGAAFARSYVLDTSAPTATLSSNVAALKAGETATITLSFSEAPVGLSNASLSATGGTLGALTATSDPLVYTVAFTPAAGVNAGSGVVQLVAGSYSDLANNAGAGVTLPAIAIDTQAPLTIGGTVSFSSDSGASTSDLVTNVAAQTLSGVLNASLVAGETVQVSLDNGATWVTATAAAGAAGWTLANQTLNAGAGQQVQVRVADAAGNHGPVVGVNYVLDQSAPTVAITSSQTSLNGAEQPLITFTFSEAPVGFSAASLSVSGGTLSGFTATANPLVYTAVLTPSAGEAAGVATVTLPAGAYTDAAGNSGQGASAPTISYNTVAPGVALSSDVSVLKAGETATITIRFSTAPTGFTDADLVVSGGTLSPVAATADPLVYTAVFTPAAGVAQGTGAIGIATGAYTGNGGVTGLGANLAPIAIDNVAPTLVITSDRAVLGAGATAVVTFTFSEAPLGFALGSLGAANGTFSNLVQTADPLVYTAVLTPNANVAGASAQITVAPFSDLAGNGGSIGAVPAIAIDTVAPTLVSGSLTFSADNGASAADLVTDTAVQDLAGTLSGPLAAGEVVEVSLDNGASWQGAVTVPGATTWLLAGQVLNPGSGVVQVRVTDGAGNHGAVTGHAYTIDTTAPTVAITSAVASLRTGQSALVTLTFSEAPSGFTQADLVAVGGTLSNFTATANPLVYTVLLTPAAGQTGGASITLANGLYTDAAGNLGTGASLASLAIDTAAPVLTIDASASSLKVGETATITFTFSEAPASFALGDISVVNGTLGNFTASADRLVYTATFTPQAGLAAGNAIVSVAPNLIVDAAGNPGAGASSAPIAIDTLAPTITGASIAFSADNGASSTDLVTSIAAQVISGTLNGALAAGDTVQVSLDNGASWLTAVATSTTQWTLPLQLLPDNGGAAGAVQVRVADAAGNAGPVFSAGYTLDQTAPTVTVASSATALRAGEAATLTFTFSEVPTGFQQADLVAINGSLSGFATTADPRVFTVQLTPGANLSGASAFVTLAPGQYTDAAGNPGAGFTSPSIAVDTTPPVLQITSSAAALALGQQAVIRFSFSELPVGFDAADVAVTGGTLSGFAQTANPLVYTAILTPDQSVASGTATVSVAGGYTDAAGNPGAPASLAPVSYRTQAPTTAGATLDFSSDTGISSSDHLTINPLQTLTGTLNANLVAGELVELSLDEGATWIAAVAPVGGNAWALPTPVLLGAVGAVLVRVSDSAGNSGPVTSTAYAIDNVAPSVTIASDTATLSAGQRANLTFTFSEPPQGFTGVSLTVAGGTVSGLSATANLSVYTAVFTPAAGYNGAASVSLAPGSYGDSAGNPGLGGVLPTITVDTLAPGLTITSSSAQLKAGDTALITFTFSELLVGFGPAAVNVSNGTLSGLSATANPLVYTAVFTPSAGVAGASAAVSVAGGDYSDLAGNAGTGASSLQIAIDTLAPAASAIGFPRFSADTGVSDADLVTSVAAQVVSGSLSLPLASGESVQVSFDNGVTWQTAAVVTSGSETTWSLAHTLTGSGVLRVRVADAVGNLSPETINAYVLDQGAPTLAITSNVAALKIGESAQITFTFSEAPQSFSADAIVVTNGVLSGLAPTANPLVYTALFVPTAGLAGGVAGIALPAAAYTDLAGNLGQAAAGPQIAIDTLPPAAFVTGSPRFSLDTGVSNTDLVTSAAQQTVSGDLSQPLAAGDAVQVSFDDGATWLTAVVNGASWSLDHLLAGSGVLQVRVVDAAGNASATTVTPYVLAQGAPTVVITSNVPVANGVEPAIITFTFSAPPVDFSAANVAVTGGTLGALTATADPLVYTATFTPPAGVPAGSASIAVSGFSDLAGNTGADTSLPSLQIDTVAPPPTSGAISFSNDTGLAGDLLTNIAQQSLSGTLSAPPAAGDVVQVSIDGGRTWLQAVIRGQAWSLDGLVLPTNVNGILAVRVADAAGNVSTLQTVPYLVDTIAPTVAITSSAAVLAPGQAVTLTFTLSDPGVLDLSNIVVAGGTLSNFSGSGTTYTATLVPTGSAPVTIGVPAQLFTDAAGNANRAAAPLVLQVGSGESVLVDGVAVTTASGVDARTGVAVRTVTVPVVGSGRAEDIGTPHATLADIPLGIGANANGVGSTLTVSVPVGVGFEASGPSVLLAGALAALDLIGRIDDHTVASGTRDAMEAQARQFLASQAADELQQNGTLRVSGSGTLDNTMLLIAGDTSVQAGTMVTAQGLRASALAGVAANAVVDLDTEIALVIDARSLSGVGLQIDNLDFGAIIGAARVQGGQGSNFLIGDDAAQHITLTTGTDNDTLYGNGGNDILGTAGGNDYLDGGDGDDILFGGGGNDVLVAGTGNDVLQGGRTDSGQWRFVLKANGTVLGMHEATLLGGMQTITAAELNLAIGQLHFVNADAVRLETLSLLYHAAFDRAPDLPGLTFWTNQAMTAQQYAAGFLAEAEARDGLMKLGNADFVATLLRHTLDREPTASELSGYVARLDGAPGDLGQRAAVLSEIALTDAHKALWWTADGMALGGELLTEEQGWIAGSGNDRLVVGSGSNLLVGGDGIDTAVFTGSAASHLIVLGNHTSAGANGPDLMVGQGAGSMNTVRQVELAEFDDRVVDLGFAQASTATLREIGMLYQLTLDRSGDIKGVQYWVGQNLTGAALAHGFTQSAEFQQKYGVLDDAAFVTQMFRNITDAAPDAATLSRWDNYLDSHSRDEMVAQLVVDATLVGIQTGSDGLTLVGHW
ncbi:hypothetical protein ASF61_14455 [Duganella sp. Leaf126]|uniref:Ig-like domain-containing protein n=1 Tax=Duganella sp. Leaf126 TaxID=1736266 RepID=UPI0006FC0117|nr:Ig-like domain-containing protein [Duganella sp. Leaf126]KQQ32736.1 hypothetical protein ASF61_14455 [Duganella sp. Leaf126]